MIDNQQNSAFHDFSKEKTNSVFSFNSLVIFIVVIFLGVGVGYFLSKGRVNSVTTTMTTQGENNSSIAKGIIIGSTDTGTFKDTAEGVVQKGGVNGEGQYHLVRPGGDSQNVYLTSSIVDLSQFIGKNIKVHGQTQKAHYAGWLMDVGQVEVE